MLSTVRHLLCGVFVALAAIAPAQADLVAEAQAAMAAGESARALDLSEEIMRRHPRDRGAMNFRAAALAAHAQELTRDENWSEAIALIDEALLLRPSSEALLSNRHAIAITAALSLAEGPSPETAHRWLAEIPETLSGPMAERRRIASGRVHFMDAQRHMGSGNSLAERRSLEQTLRWTPENMDAHVALIECLYSLRVFEEAQRRCRVALALDPSRNDLRDLSLKMSRDERALVSHRIMRTEHFAIHHPPRQGDFAALCARLLEDAHREMSEGFGVTPLGEIEVIIYNENDFRDVMLAPHWAQAGYDGRLRLFLVDASSREARRRLEDSLTHELTHAFVVTITHDSCPTWLNEGLASNLEANRHFSNDDIQEIRRIVDRRDSIAITDLPADFGTVHGLEEAQDTYHIAHCFVHWLIRTQGLENIGSMLNALGEGTASHEAIADHLGATLDELDHRWRAGL